MPVPFSIAGVLVLCGIGLSRLLQPTTAASLAMLGCFSVVTVICNLFYFGKLMSNWAGTSVGYGVVLILGLLLNYITNVLFLFMSRHTLLRDEQFLNWKRGHIELFKDHDQNQASHANLRDALASEAHSEQELPSRLRTYDCAWICILVFGGITSHTLYVLLFSKLFGLALFSASVQSVKSLSHLNYLWVSAIVAHLFCMISGAILASSTDLNDPAFL